MAIIRVTLFLLLGIPGVVQGVVVGPCEKDFELKCLKEGNLYPMSKCKEGEKGKPQCCPASGPCVDPAAAKDNKDGGMSTTGNKPVDPCEKAGKLQCKDGSAPEKGSKCKEGKPQCCSDGKCVDPVAPKDNKDGGKSVTGDKPPKAMATGDKPPKKFVKGCGDKAGIEKVFKKCVASAEGDGATKCKEALMKTMKEKCGKTVDKVEQKKLLGEEARKSLAKCKMAKVAGVDCDKKFRAMTGAPEPKDAKKAALEGKTEAMKGAREALAGEMSECMKANDAKKCKAEMTKKLGNLQGRDVSQAELAGEMQQAGRSAAGKAIKDCLAAAADATAKKACMTSSDAKSMYAAASGRKVGDIKDSDLRAASRESAQKDLKDTLNACTEEAADAQAKKACFQRPDLKSKIADSQNVDAANVKDSKVREYLQKSGRKDALAVMQSCDKKTEKSKCMELMKDLKAQSSGKAAKDISDDELKRDANSAMRSELADKMSACMEEAADDKKKMGECKTVLAKDTIKGGDFDGKVPSKAKIQGMLKSAAKSKAMDVMKDCTDADRKKCMALAKERIGQTMGKGKGEVSTKEAELFNKAGAVDAVNEGAKACMDAKKDNPQATCDDLYAEYLASRKRAKPSTPAGEKADKGRVMMNAAKTQMKADLKVCLEADTKAKADTCLAGFKGKRD